MDSLKLLIQRHLRAIWRNRWLALLAAWVICLVGWAGVWFVPNQYESSARLYVDADAVLTPLLRGLAADSAAGSQIEVLQRTLLSRPNLETLISKTDLDMTVRNQSERERLVQQLGNDIKLIPQTRTLFTIGYRTTVPKLAHDVVQTLLTIFVERATGANRSDMENARRFLESQIASYERQLRAAEQRRAEFRQRYAEILPGGLPAGGANPAMGRLETMRALVAQLQGELTDVTRRRDALKAELEVTQPLLVIESTPTVGPGSLNARLIAAQQRLDELKLRYTDEHPEIVQQRQLIALIRATPMPEATPQAPPPQARTTEDDGRPATTAGETPRTPEGVAPSGTARETARREAAQGGRRPRAGGATAPTTPVNARNLSTPNPIYERIKERLLDAEALLGVLTRKHGEAVRERDRMEAVARAFPTVEAEFMALDRDYSVMQRNYQELLARRESANIAQAADTQADKVRLQVVDPPQLPRLPVAPNRMVLFSGVFVIGLGAGGALAFLLGQFDRSFHTVEELRNVGLTVLGGITLLGTAPRRRTTVATLGFVAGVLLLGAIYAGLMARVLRASALV